jgi:hypothetical protein
VSVASVASVQLLCCVRQLNVFTDLKSLVLEVPTFFLVIGCVSARRDERNSNIKWAIGSGHSRLWNTAGFLVGKKWDFGGLHMVLGGTFTTGLNLEELNQMPELCSTILKAINNQATVTSSDRLSNLSDIEKRKPVGVEVAQWTEVEEFWENAKY